MSREDCPCSRPVIGRLLAGRDESGDEACEGRHDEEDLQRLGGQFSHNHRLACVTAACIHLRQKAGDVLARGVKPERENGTGAIALFRRAQAHVIAVIGPVLVQPEAKAADFAASGKSV